MIRPTYFPYPAFDNKLIPYYLTPVTGLADASRSVISVVYDFVSCHSVCIRTLKGKRRELLTPNLVYVYSMTCLLACIDPEVKRSKVKVTLLRKPSPSHGCYLLLWPLCSLCYCCRRETARRVTCLGFYLETVYDPVSCLY